MICRLCLKRLSAEDAIYLFKSNEGVAETQLVKIIAKFLQLEITPDDSVSTYLCAKCCEHLEEFYSFWLLVEQKQNSLHKDFMTVDCDAVTTWPIALDELPICPEVEIDEKPLDLNFANLPIATTTVLKECEKIETDYDEVLLQAGDANAQTDEDNNDEVHQYDEEEFAAAKLDESTDDELPLMNLVQKLNRKKPKSKMRRTRNRISEAKNELKKLLQENATTSQQSGNTTDTLEISDVLEGKVKNVSKVVLSRRYEELIASFMRSNCDLCEFSTEFFSDLRTHFMTEHKCKAYLKCCNKIFSKPCKLVEHVRKHLNPDAFKCHICQKSLSSQEYLQTHLETIHRKTDSSNSDNQKFACTKCDKVFSSQKRQENHIEKHSHDGLQFDCDLCGKSFANTHRLRRHKESIHEDLHPHICDICGKKFKFKPSFERHLLAHQGIYEQPMQCQKCGVWLKNLQSHRLHAFTHDNRNTGCPHCGKICSSRTALRAHVKYTHRMEVNLQCTFCDKTFKMPRNLEEHMAIHTGQQLYNCPHCPKECRSRSNMYVHIKQRHAEEWLRAKMARSHNPNAKLINV